MIPRYRGGANIKGLPNHHRGGKMNIFKSNILKGFAALIILGMVGALVAEPVALGNLGIVYAIKSWHEGNVKGSTIGEGLMDIGSAAVTDGVAIWLSAEEASTVLLAAGIATGGVALAAVGTTVMA